MDKQLYLVVFIQWNLSIYVEFSTYFQMAMRSSSVQDCHVIRVARSKSQNSEIFSPQSENHRKSFWKNWKKIGRDIFLQNNGCYVELPASIALPRLCSLIDALFSKVAYSRKQVYSIEYIIELTQKLLKDK